MRSSPDRQAAFTLLELLMALGLFAIAAVSLANAINLISLSVAESVEDVEVREQLRGVLLETSRNPNLEVGSRTISTGRGIVYEVEVEQLNLENRAARTLEEIYEVKVTARRELGGQRSEFIDSADTLVYREMFGAR